MTIVGNLSTLGVCQFEARWLNYVGLDVLKIFLMALVAYVHVCKIILHSLSLSLTQNIPEVLVNHEGSYLEHGVPLYRNDLA